MDGVLVTGATGAVGNKILLKLLASGRHVRALVRSPERAARVVPEGCELVTGDVTDPESIRRAMQGCGVVFHAAGLPEQWLEDASRFDRVNVDGTRNMIEAALELKVQRFVYTSTIDVFAAPPGTPFDESHIDEAPKGTAYERSKQAADKIVTAALAQGLPAVFLHPSAVYGPSAGSSPTINDMIARLLQHRLPALVPGAVPLVYVDDVAEGHLLAEKRAPVGGRYILSDTTVTLAEIGEMVAREAGLGRVPPTVPLGAARVLSRIGERVASVRKQPPLVPEGQLTFLTWRARPVARRARAELHWEPTPLAAGLRSTIAYLRDHATG